MDTITTLLRCKDCGFLLFSQTFHFTNPKTNRNCIRCGQYAMDPITDDAALAAYRFGGVKAVEAMFPSGPIEDCYLP